METEAKWDSKYSKITHKCSDWANLATCVDNDTGMRVNTTKLQSRMVNWMCSEVSFWHNWESEMALACPQMESKGVPWRHPRAANVAPGRLPTENSSRQKRWQMWPSIRKELISKRERHLRSGPTHTLEMESSSTHLWQEFDFIKGPSFRFENKRSNNSKKLI